MEFISTVPGNSEMNSKEKFKLFCSTLSHGGLGIRYWVLGTGYQVLATRYWVPGRPEADLREAGGRLIGGSGVAEPPSKKVLLFVWVSKQCQVLSEI